jgi:hypothetical protein
MAHNGKAFIKFKKKEGEKENLEIFECLTQEETEKIILKND